MKYKHTITIADIQMNIVTEEEPEVVESMVGVLDRRIREIFLKSENRCPKIEAALLCALDYCSEKIKLQETVNRMEEERRGIDIDAMLAELAELKADNEKLNSQLTYAEDQARTMKNGIDIANDQIRILKTQVSEAEDKTAALTAELDSAKQIAASADGLEAKIAELEAALEAKTAEIEAKNAEYDAKAAECDVKNAEHEAKVAEFDAKTAEFDKLSKAYEEATEKIKELEDEIGDLEDEIDELEKKNDVKPEEVAEPEDEIVVEITVEEDDTPEAVEDVVAEAVAEGSTEEAVVETAEEKIEEEKAEEASENAEPEKRPVAAIADNIEDAFELDMKPLRRGNIDGNQLTIDSELNAGEKKQEEKPAEKTSVEAEKQKAHKRVRSMFDLITFDNV